MQRDKKIVLDANILIRAVLGKKVRGILEQYSSTGQFFTPDVCYQDALKYLPLLFEKRNLPVQPALEVLEQLTCLIDIIDDNLYRLYEKEARQRIAVRDVNDWPIVALSLMLD